MEGASSIRPNPRSQTEPSITATKPGDYWGSESAMGKWESPVAHTGLLLWGSCRTPVALQKINHSGICRGLKRYLLQRLTRRKLEASLMVIVRHTEVLKIFMWRKETRSEWKDLGQGKVSNAAD